MDSFVIIDVGNVSCNETICYFQIQNISMIESIDDRSDQRWSGFEDRCQGRRQITVGSMYQLCGLLRVSTIQHVRYTAQALLCTTMYQLSLYATVHVTPLRIYVTSVISTTTTTAAFSEYLQFNMWDILQTITRTRSVLWRFRSI